MFCTQLAEGSMGNWNGSESHLPVCSTSGQSSGKRRGRECPSLARLPGIPPIVTRHAPECAFGGNVASPKGCEIQKDLRTYPVRRTPIRVFIVLRTSRRLNFSTFVSLSFKIDKKSTPDRRRRGRGPIGALRRQPFPPAGRFAPGIWTTPC
jgi:hypothetical protein